MIYLLIATGFSSTLQLVGVGTIVPFMALVSDPSLVEQSSWAAKLSTSLGLADHETLITVIGSVVFLALALSSAITTLTAYFGQLLAAHINQALSIRLLSAYLSRPYSWFLGKNSIELGRNLLNEVSGVSGTFVLPLTNALVSIGTSAALITALLLADPRVALLSTLSLGVSYFAIYQVTKQRLDRYAKRRINATGEKHRSAHEALRGLKTLRLFHCEEVFISRFAAANRVENHVKVLTSTIASAPKQIVEVLTFGGLIAIVIHLANGGTASERILPLLSLYAVCALRLLPALQRSYAALSSVRANAPSVEILYEDILQAEGHNRVLSDSSQVLELKDQVSMESLSFSYPEGDQLVLDGISLRIPRNTSVGLVGRTGAGKTTLVDLLLGFLDPTEGCIKVDDTALDRDNIRAWQRNLGYVPQQIFIIDDTVRKNIAFGLDEDQIDDEKVRLAARAANLDEFIETELSDGYSTYVGEGGIRLSGGQRQRLGIARALYYNPDVLVLDEATSALDGVTEAAVMDAIKKLGGNKTLILIAHRLTTLQECDTIFLLDAGKVASQGTYDELMRNCPQFQAFARASAGDDGDS